MIKCRRCLIYILLAICLLQTGLIVRLIYERDYRHNTSRPTERFYVATGSPFIAPKTTAQSGGEYTLVWPRQDNKDTVIIYMSSMCASCTKHLPALSEVAKVFSDSNYEFVVLWEDSIPRNLSKDSIQHLRISDNTALAASIPFMCVVDHLGEVSFSADYSTRYLTQFLLKGHHADNSDYARQALAVLKKHQTTDHELCVAFHTEQCISCAQSDELLKNMVNNKKFEILVIGGTSISSLPYFNDEYLYSEVLGIATYPKYLYLSRSGDFEFSDSLSVD